MGARSEHPSTLRLAVSTGSPSSAEPTPAGVVLFLGLGPTQLGRRARRLQTAPWASAASRRPQRPWSIALGPTESLRWPSEVQVDGVVAIAEPTCGRRLNGGFGAENRKFNVPPLPVGLWALRDDPDVRRVGLLGRA